MYADQLRAIGDSKLEDLEIDGDRASAKIITTVNGTTRTSTGRFRRVEGRWYLTQ